MSEHEITSPRTIARKTVIGGAIAAAVVALREMKGAQAATPKSAVCQPCGGNGNCLSKSCVNRLCAPYSNVCGTAKRPLYTCKAGKKGNAVRSKCCDAGGGNCRAI